MPAHEEPPVLPGGSFLKQQDEETIETKWIVWDGVRYYPRRDLVVMMLLGIDREGKLEENVSNSGYAADMVTLVIFDEKTKEVSLLCLNRDTMVKMPGLNEHGVQTGTYYRQLALSHAFGSGLEDSCENTRTTVSDYLYGINIDYYLSMNMDGIAVLNDAVGGVTVTVSDDFSHVDPTLSPGEVTLKGEQAMNFVRQRKAVGDQLNITRMERQKMYIKALFDVLKARTNESASFALSVYEEISPYIVTDCSANVITNLMERYGDYTFQEMVSPEGENVLGEKHYEFYADEEKLDELILRLFYAPQD